MQAEITFSANTVERKMIDFPETFPTIKPIQGFRQFIEESDWDERLSEYEKYINRVSCVIIIASAIYLIPVCIHILIR